MRSVSAMAAEVTPRSAALAKSGVAFSSETFMMTVPAESKWEHARTSWSLIAILFITIRVRLPKPG